MEPSQSEPATFLPNAWAFWSPHDACTEHRPLPAESPSTAWQRREHPCIKTQLNVPLPPALFPLLPLIVDEGECTAIGVASGEDDDDDDEEDDDDDKVEALFERSSSSSLAAPPSNDGLYAAGNSGRIVDLLGNVEVQPLPPPPSAFPSPARPNAAARR